MIQLPWWKVSRDGSGPLFYRWRTETCVLLSGTVLVPISVNNLDDYVFNIVSKSLDYTKIGFIVDHWALFESLTEKIFESLTEMGHQIATMEFSSDKCEMVHFGKLNKHRTNKENDWALESGVDQRDLGVHVQRTLKEWWVM